MNIPKDEIIKLIESKQGRAVAEGFGRRDCSIIDHLEHAPLLAKFGIDPQALLSKVGGAEEMQKSLDGLLGGHWGREPAEPTPPTST